MGLTDEQTEALKQPLDDSRVAERAQSGNKFKYLEGWDVIARANEIFGFDGWQREFTSEPSVQAVVSREINKNGREGWEVAYICAYRVTVADQVVEDVGYGSGISYNSPGDAHESAAKEAVTDALKRCLRSWGEQFGNSLYNKSYAPAEPKPTKLPGADHRRLEALMAAKGVDREVVRKDIAKRRNIHPADKEFADIHLDHLFPPEFEAVIKKLEAKEDKESK